MTKNVYATFDDQVGIRFSKTLCYIYYFLLIRFSSSVFLDWRPWISRSVIVQFDTNSIRLGFPYLLVIDDYQYHEK